MQLWCKLEGKIVIILLDNNRITISSIYKISREPTFEKNRSAQSRVNQSEAISKYEENSSLS